MYLVLFFLGALLATASTVWILAQEYEKERNYWKERLIRVADTNTLLFRRWIQQRNKDVQVLASFPTVQAAVVEETSLQSPDHIRVHTASILNLTHDTDIYSALYVLDNGANVVAQTSGAARLTPEVLQSYRKFTDAGMLTLYGSQVNGVFPSMAVIAPIQKPRSHGLKPVDSTTVSGAVILVTKPEALSPLFLTDVSTTTSGETLFVARRGSDGIFVSPLRNETVHSAPQRKPGRPGLLAVEGQEVFGDYTDYRSEPVFAVTRFIPEVGWGMVTKIDRKEALSRFHHTVIQDVLILLVSLAGLASAGFGIWRHQQVHGLRREIFRRRETEDRLRESEHRFYTAFRSSPAGMTISTFAEGRYIEANDVFLRTLGYQRDEVIGNTSIELRIWARQEDREAMIRRMESGELVREIELSARTKSGQIRQVLLSLERIHVQDAPCLLATVRDITDHKLLEEQLRQSQKMEAVGRLAGGVAHDFNNLLAIIIGYSELLLERVSGSEQNRQTVEHILDAGRRAADLTRQLLAFSRRQVLQPKAVDLNAVVEDAQKLLRRLIGEDIELLVSLEPAAGHVMADPGQLVQVILNLAVNSRDAMPGGGRLTIETRSVAVDGLSTVVPSPQKPGRYVLLTVSDTGSGMDQETQDHLFEPFFTTKGLGKGTGLGLSTVYGIVKQSNGFIWVESEPGQGTIFRIYLPQLVSSVSHEQHARRLQTSAGGAETILIAEDEVALREVTRQSLETAGYRVLEAKDAQDAIHIAEEYGKPIDLLLTDMVMPLMSGPALAQAVRRIRPDIKVAYVSGHAEALVQHPLDDDKATFLQKPFTRGALLNEIRQLLDAPPATN